MAALKAHRKAQLEEKLAWGPAWTESGLVFCREDGRPLDPQKVSNTFARLGRDAGLPTLTLHGLWHSFATLALGSGVHPKIVSSRLGHSSVGITLDRYSHVVEAVGEDAAAKVASLILG